jgi:hypothetical protein
MPAAARVAILGGMDTAADQTPLCRLEGAMGKRVRCPQDACAFWEPGGAVLDGECVLAGIDFSREPGLADWLLDFRGALEAGAPLPHASGHEFRRVLSQGRE